MVAQRKGGGNRISEVQEDLARTPLQAILLADSFAQKFRPVTLERPKVLLPLVNVPMIDYTLAWLESAGVEEVFVFCCAHSKQVIDHLENSQWFSQPNISVTTIESHNSISAGDALRFIYERNVIHGDFILISGDTVSNMPLTQALQEHKDRRKKDSNAVMTMIIKRSKPSPNTNQSRLGTDELFMAIDPITRQLLFYEEKAYQHKGTLTLDKMLLADNSCIFLQNDKQDCYIDICSPEVLSLFTDNFDYQHLRRHFVKGLLVDDIMGYKIYTHETKSSYAARIDNFRSYDTISKDIIQRWTYPLVPDANFLGHSSVKFDRWGMYKGSEVQQARSAQIGPFNVIGSGTVIGNDTKILSSVVGESCIIGSNVLIEGSYVWNNVTIEDGCKLMHAIVCDGVIMKSGATLNPGVILSFNVVIGEQFLVPAYSKVSLYQQPTQQDSDEELEYADQSSGMVDISFRSNLSELNRKLTAGSSETPSEVGAGGAGYIWSACEESIEEEWRHSVAPISEDKLAEMALMTDDDLELSGQDGKVSLPSGELKADSVSDESEDDEKQHSRDDSAYFEKEVEATFVRAVNENIKEDHVILEVNSLRLSCNMSSSDCAGALFYSVMKLSLETPHNSDNELVKNAGTSIDKWKKLLQYYLPSIDEQIEVILKFEEMCLESTKELSPLFQEILHLLYMEDILQEESIFVWAAEKEAADESDRVFVKQSAKFIEWLKNAEEEEDDAE